MENRFLYKLNEVVVVNIKTKNVERLLKKLYNIDISIFKLDKINYKEINAEIYKKDLNKVKKISILNKVKIIDYKGKLKLKNKLRFNKNFIFSICIGILVLIFLSNVVFNIEVIHSKEYLRNLVMKELNKNGIKKYTLKKSYNELNKIRNAIISNNKNYIEWLEIESIGTKYIVRIEERKINENKNIKIYQDIIATKDAVVKKIIASNGVVITKINDYVKKGDILISGSIYLNDSLKGFTNAKGYVYGEVWYNMSIIYPILDIIKEETGNKKNSYSINFLNKKKSLKKQFESNNIVSKKIFKNNILPISITYDTFYEIKNIEGIYSEGENLLNARNYAKMKMQEILKKDEYIISDSLLKYRINSNTIYMEIFYKVFSNITGTREIILE